MIYSLCDRFFQNYNLRCKCGFHKSGHIYIQKYKKILKNKKFTLDDGVNCIGPTIRGGRGGRPRGRSGRARGRGRARRGVG